MNNSKPIVPVNLNTLTTDQLSTLLRRTILYTDRIFYAVLGQGKKAYINPETELTQCVADIARLSAELQCRYLLTQL